MGTVAITKASYEHWLPIEAVITWRTLPLERAPLGVLPDSPGFHACIEWLGSAAGLSGGSSLSVAQRKLRCERLLEELKRKTLEFLITDQWYTGELRDRHVKVSGAELQHTMSFFLNQELHAGDYDKYLAATGMSDADVHYFQRRNTNWEKVRAEILDQPSLADVTPALTRFTSKWVAATSCRPAYVVPGCRQYHGPLPTP